MARSKGKRSKRAYTQKQYSKAKAIIRRKIRREKGLLPWEKVPGEAPLLSPGMPRVLKIPRISPRRLILKAVRDRYRRAAKLATATTLAQNRANVRELNRRVEKERTRCEQRSQRKAVLLAIDKVTRSGGAPGPYRRRPDSKETCK